MTNQKSDAPATSFAVALIGEFIRWGVLDVVLSPGSRSQALALAAAEYERAGLVRLRVRIDERVAGFTALGLSVETGVPTVVIMTSGTAVANLHPAVLEAHHSGVPMIVISADRPAELRGIGSSQTTVQPGIFAGAVRASWDVAAPVARDDAGVAAAVAQEAFAAAVSGPVHVNIAFTEPLSSALSELPALSPSPSAPATVPSDAFELEPRPGTLVIAGTGAGEVAETTARALGVPLIAEVSSGAHFGPNLVVAYRALLNQANFGDRVERVIVFGHPTLSREVPALIQRDGVETIVVRSPGADDYNPGHRVARFVDSVTVALIEPDPAASSWLGRWVSASRELLEPPATVPASELGAADFARRELAAVREPVSRRLLVEAVWRATWPHDRLVLGASRLIRVVDTFVPGKKIVVHSNRGLAGIDGTISTGMGVALATTAQGTTRVLLGDLAALHDSGALLIGRGEPRPRIHVIVGNDGGGTIFDGLEVATNAAPELVDRVMLTAQNVDFESLARAYGWDYLRATTRGELDQALTATGGPLLIEVPLARGD